MAMTVGTILVNVIGNASGLKSTLDAAENSVTKFGSGMARLGARMTTGITLPLAALLGGIGKIGMKFDDEMMKSTAIMEGVDANLRKRMEQRAMSLSEKLRFSSTEIAQGYYDLASAGFNAEDSLENIGTVATFAQAGLLKMNTAGEYLAGAVKALGTDLTGATTEAEAMSRVADVLTAANNSALGTVEDFSQALTTRFASGMKQANMSLEEGVGFLMAYAQQNIKGKDASMQAWMALRDVQTKAITAADAWKQYGVSVYDTNNELRRMPDILKQIQMRMDGFSKKQVETWLMTGVDPKKAGIAPENAPMAAREKRQFMLDLKLPDRSVSSIQKVLSESENIDSFVDRLKDSLGEADRVAEKQMQSVAARFDAALNRIQNIGIRLFLNMKPILIDVLNVVGDFTEKVNWLAEKFMMLNEPTRKAILGMTALVMVAGPLLWIFGSLITTIGLMMSMGGKLIPVFMGISKAIINVVGNAQTLARAANGRFMTPVGLKDAAKYWDEIKLSVASFASGFQKAINIAKVALIPLLEFFLKAYVLVQMLWPAMKELGTQIYSVFDRMFSFSGKAKDEWLLFTEACMASKSAWDKWWDTAKNVLHILNNLFTTIQFGWVMLVRFAFVVGGEFVNSLISAWEWVKNLFTTMGKMWDGFTGFIRDIPYLGSMFEWLWEKGSKGAQQMWEVISAVLSDIAQGIVKLSGMAFNFIAPGFKDSPIGALVSSLSGIASRSKDIHDATKQAADEFDRWLKSVGAVEEKVDEMAGGGDLGQGMFGPPAPKGPRGAGSNDGPPPSPNAAKRDPVDEAYKQLMGDGGRQWRDMAKAVELHKKEIFGNSEAMERLWDIYKGVRDTIGPSGLKKELDELFATNIAVEEMERFGQTFGDMWNDLYNNGETQSALEKQLSLVEEFVKERQALLAGEGAAGGSVFTPEFFTKYADQIEKLSENYGTHSESVKVLIDEYWKWANAQAATERGAANLQKANEALSKIVAAHADMVAQVADKNKELADNRLTEDGRAIRGISRNQEKLQLEFDKSNAEMLNSFKFMEGTKLGEALKTFFAIKESQKELLAVTKQLDFERSASAIGLSQVVVRASKHMTEEQKKHLLELQVKSKQVQAVWGEWQNTFSTMASVFDKDGDKAITWLATISGLMQEATKAGTDLKTSGMAFMASMSKGDFAGMAAAATSFFSALAQGISIMDRATASGTKFQSTMGGAMTGAQLGGQVGGGWGAVIGGIVGGFVGFFRASNREWAAYQKMLAEMRAAVGTAFDEFKKRFPEMKNHEAIMAAFGVTLQRVTSQAQMDALISQIQELTNRLIDLNSQFGTLLGQAADIGIGLPSDIEASINALIELGIISGETAEKWKSMLGAGDFDWKKIKEAADRIGLSEEKLGKAYQQKRMNATAKSLIDDFEAVMAGGADINDVLDAMKDEINALVLDSMKFGTTIPENMKPWIQALIDAGKLVDENGQLITSLDGIQFGPEIKSQFEEITDAIRDLIEELKKLPGLFNGIPPVPGGGTPGGGTPGGGGGDGGGEEGTPVPQASNGYIPTRYVSTAGPGGVVAGASAGGGNVFILPVAVGDATNIEDLAAQAVASLPDAIAENRNNLKYAIISAARATSVPRTTRR